MILDMYENNKKVGSHGIYFSHGAWDTERKTVSLLFKIFDNEAGNVSLDFSPYEAQEIIVEIERIMKIG